MILHRTQTLQPYGQLLFSVSSTNILQLLHFLRWNLPATPTIGSVLFSPIFFPLLQPFSQSMAVVCLPDRDYLPSCLVSCMRYQTRFFPKSKPILINQLLPTYGTADALRDSSRLQKHYRPCITDFARIPQQRLGCTQRNGGWVCCYNSQAFHCRECNIKPFGEG